MIDPLLQLKVYNTLTKKKELYVPIKKDFTGMYVCGPTVYSNVHLGNIRTFTSFDIIYRYLQFLGYKVRYVRNITDVGHLEENTDEDKISKKAKKEAIEPMQVVQKYTTEFHEIMRLMNNLPVDIEPTATGHITEQIEWIESIMKKGYAYEVNGSVYFDTVKLNKYKKDEDYHYGVLSGRNIEETKEGTRTLDSQSEKRNLVDFALWKKATPSHIMRWKSPWGYGFPGWHLECSVMSSKYLGNQFDIHGGGIDLVFPHHECEIAQNKIKSDYVPARYWLHTNMLTINGTKMSKSLNNSILPFELFTGVHPLLSQAYSPMIMRFFMLQTHYSSTMDISDEALSSAKKGYNKLCNAIKAIKEFQQPKSWDSAKVNLDQKKQIEKLCDNCYFAMNDDFNTARLLATLFNMIKKINGIVMGQIDVVCIGETTFLRLKKVFLSFVENVLGLKIEENINQTIFMDALIQFYITAKKEKNYDQVDVIRAYFKKAGISIQDSKTKITWAYEE